MALPEVGTAVPIAGRSYEVVRIEKLPDEVVGSIVVMEFRELEKATDAPQLPEATRPAKGGK